LDVDFKDPILEAKGLRSLVFGIVRIFEV